MSTLSKSSKELSQITLSSQLTSHYDYSTENYELVPSSCDYQNFGNASWKIAVSWVDGNASVTLFCRRKSSSDTFLAVCSVYLTAAGNPYSLRDVQIQGHATFSGATLETTTSIGLNFNYDQLDNMYSYKTTLQMNITIWEPSAEDMSVKIYTDAFSSVDKAQLFSESSPYPRDCVIKFSDGKQVHVQKSLLSMHSEFWKEKFAKDKDRKEFLSENFDYGEFIDLLSVIYPTAHPITDENVETLSKLAYKFHMPELLKRCDIFLMANSAKFGKSKLLFMAQIYKFERLQAHCISGYKTIEDIKAIKGESDYAYLDDRTKRMLLDNILGIDSSVPFEVSVTNYTSCDLATNETRAAAILKKLTSLTSCPSDIVLVVGNARIPAHKQLLSFFSEFFNNMFQSEFKESRESEIMLEEVSYGEMVELLSVTYPTDYYFINETNIATVVKLADRFVMPMILERCKKELKNSSKINGALKLWLVQQYGSLAELQEEFVRKCKCVEDVQKLKTEPEFGLLDNKMRSLILESIIENETTSTSGIGSRTGSQMFARVSRPFDEDVVKSDRPKRRQKGHRNSIAMF